VSLQRSRPALRNLPRERKSGSEGAAAATGRPSVNNGPEGVALLPSLDRWAELLLAGPMEHDLEYLHPDEDFDRSLLQSSRFGRVKAAPPQVTLMKSIARPSTSPLTIPAKTVRHYPVQLSRHPGRWTSG
jgi:hypothetical protein